MLPPYLVRVSRSYDDITYAPVPDLISEFIDAADEPSRSTGPASDSVFRTVLFTDLVGHTAMMSRLGDEKGREVLRDSERLYARRAGKRMGGPR